MRQPGVDAPPSGPLPALLRILFLLQTLIFAVVGVALFIVPADVAPWWPWMMTPLAGRVIGAWLVAVAVAGAGILTANDRPRAGAGRPDKLYAFFGILQLLAVLRLSADVDWSHALAWPYVAFMGAGKRFTGIPRASSPGDEARIGTKSGTVRAF